MLCNKYSTFEARLLKYKSLLSYKEEEKKSESGILIIYKHIFNIIYSYVNRHIGCMGKLYHLDYVHMYAYSYKLHDYSACIYRYLNN